MNRLQNSLAIARQSWQVLRTNPNLSIFPILSAIASILVSIPFIAPIVLIGMHAAAHTGGASSSLSVQSDGDQGTYILRVVLGFLYYFVTYAVVVFFNSALVFCADKSLRGEPSTLSDGIQAAMRRMPQILGWAALAATVGQILRAVQERAGIVGAIVGGLIGMVWNIAIFFVVPMIVLEGMGPVQALKTSAAQIKASWGEQLILNFGLGLAGLIFAFLPFLGLLIGGGIVASVVPALGIGIIVFAFVYLIAAVIALSVLQSIYQTALYLFVRTGTVYGGYQEYQLQGAFIQKPPRKFF